MKKVIRVRKLKDFKYGNDERKTGCVFCDLDVEHIDRHKDFKKEQIKEILIKKTKFDLKCDRIMSAISLAAIAFQGWWCLFISLKTETVMIFQFLVLFFLIWYNSVLITERNLKTLEVM